jgi:hypothetical protein
MRGRRFWLACDLAADACRREHIARYLVSPEPDGTDYEAHCPACGHGGFRVSAARVRAYRNVWTCACKLCRCTPGAIRAALLVRDIPAACLGIYDGPVRKDIDPEAARTMSRAIGDILAVPHLRPADMRLMLAEAQGRKVPGEFGLCVKFAVSLGIGKTQAKEAAGRWCRPSDSHPQTGGGVVDTES